MDAETVWRASAGALSREETDALLERSIRDPELALAWQMAAKLQGAMASAVAEDETEAANENRPRGQVVPMRRRTPVQRVAPWALAAGLLLALAGSFVFGPEPPAETPDVLRSAETPSEQIIATSAPVLPRDAFVLAWRPPAALDGARYRLWLTTDELSPVAEMRDLETSEAVVDPDALGDLADGTRLLWRVEAQAGGEVVESETFVVTLGASSDG